MCVCIYIYILFIIYIIYIYIYIYIYIISNETHTTAINYDEVISTSREMGHHYSFVIEAGTDVISCSNPWHARIPLSDGRFCLLGDVVLLFKSVYWLALVCCDLSASFFFISAMFKCYRNPLTIYVQCVT